MKMVIREGGRHRQYPLVRVDDGRAAVPESAWACGGRKPARSAEPIGGRRRESSRRGHRRGQPEVWLCAGERIADLLRPEAEWPFVKQHLTGIKLYVGQRKIDRRQAPSNSDRLRRSCGW